MVRGREHMAAINPEKLTKTRRKVDAEVSFAP